MPKRVKRARSDSTYAQTQAAQKPDTSTAPLPEIDGVEALNAAGLAFFADIYRSDPNRFTNADLAMLVEAAYVHQLMVANRAVLAKTAPTYTQENGKIARHPLFAQQELWSRQLQSLLRDAGVRGRDGFKASKPPASVDKDSPTEVTPFETYLQQVVNG